MQVGVAQWAIAVAERGAPDSVIRAGIRRTIRARLNAERTRDGLERDQMLGHWHRGPIALVPGLANEQHYEVPPEFFELILGPRMKYSSCLWPSGTNTLRQAEEAMLELSAERAGLEDGMRVLDLGSGWGSMSLWIAERYPESEVVAVSNSVPQGAFIRSRVEQRGLRNVRHVVRDVNALELEGRFDAVVSVEMLEHVRNHPALLEQVASALQPNAQVFVHVFAHRDLLWEFEDRGTGDWMARTFFSGGIMPSHTDFRRLVAPFAVEQSWWESGLHYQKTLEAWLGLLDAHRPEVTRALAPVYGAQTDLWVQRWRIFLMACSEFFGYSGGDLLGVSHHRLRLA